MTVRPQGQNQRTTILAAVLRVARADKTGMALFGDTTRAFLLSLVPLIALPLVISLVTLLRGDILKAVTDLLAAICVLLVPPIVSHALARRWSRETLWLRFAVAFNWCQFALSALCMAILIALGIVFGAASAAPGSSLVVAAFAILCVALVGYGLWLHWFIVRVGLAVSGGRAAFLVFAVYAGTMAVLIGRGLLFMERG